MIESDDSEIGSIDLVHKLLWSAKTTGVQQWQAIVWQ